MTLMLTPQQKADKVAATFNRIMQKANDAPMTVEKVAQLHIARGLLAEIEGMSVGALAGVVFVDRLDDVRRDLSSIENDCRLGGLYEAFANLSRAERRRMTKLIGGDND